MKCTSPSDIYMLLKSSDFVLHDLDRDQLFEDCDTADEETLEYELELILRKWHPVDRSRELRCFVRREKLLGTFLYPLSTCRTHSENRRLTTGFQLLRLLE